MTTITLPPDLESRLSDEARRQGTTPELLALDGLRKLYAPPPASNGNGSEEGSLFDTLAGYIGAVDGASEPYSENGGQKFADGLFQKHQRGQS